MKEVVGGQPGTRRVKGALGGAGGGWAANMMFGYKVMKDER